MLKSYDEMRKIDVLPFVEKRDNKFQYLNWAKCIDLLHEHGAETVYFEPMVNERTGSSLFMTNEAYGDDEKYKNRCYEVGVNVYVDDKHWQFRGPLMNGANPVRDNSLTQQRVWNCQTRLFVKCIAIHTGLGFDLWLKEENEQEKQAEANQMDDLYLHDIIKIKKRVQQLVTVKMDSGKSIEDISKIMNMSEEEFRAMFAKYSELARFEKALSEI